jgi:hypothetical protein
MLFEESGIDPGVAEERGTFTATRGKDVPQGQGKLPAKPGLVFPVHTLDGGTFHRLRPNNPGRSGAAKYMQPKGAPNRLDVHPRQHAALKGTGGMRYLTEGEKKVDAGVSRGLLMVGVSGVFNGQRDKGAALIDDWRLLSREGENYSITFDSDIETNQYVQLAADRYARLLRAAGANAFITLLPPAPDGGKQGLDDFFVNGGTVKQLELLTRPYDEAVLKLNSGNPGNPTPPITAADLMAMTFEPTRWVVPGVLPEGLSLLAGKPKKGKSWMALGMCEAVAVGGVAFGTRRVEQGDTLYLALEDNTKRLQKRLRKVLDGRAAPEKMHLHTAWPRLDEGGAEQLDEWLTEHPDTRLVVIDTLAKIRKPAGGANIYAEDYAALELLLPLAAKHGVAIVVVHHLRKMAAADPMDEISSSTGLTAGVDGFLILRRAPGSKGPTLYVDGRDIEEPTEYALRWNMNTATWTIEGDAEAVHLSRERGDILLTLNRSPEPMTPKEVADVTPGGTHSSVKKLMWTMLGDGQLIKDDKGSYSPTNPTNHGNPGNPGNPGNSGNRGNPPGESPQESFPPAAGLPGLPGGPEGGNPTYPDRYGEYDGRVTGVTGVTGAEACLHGTPTGYPRGEHDEPCPCDSCNPYLRGEPR